MSAEQSHSDGGKIELPFDGRTLTIRVPRPATIYRTAYPALADDAGGLVLAAMDEPVGCEGLEPIVRRRRPGPVVVVVSDITRPIPYGQFLPALLARIERAGVARQDIIVLIATGMHRPSTPDERLRMFGREVCERYTIVDHRADRDDELAELPMAGPSGRPIRLNRLFVNAGLRILTGLVEPHFMAGFSGGRKSICPGLASLETIQRFHGYATLADAHATNASLDGNPCHAESLAIAKAAGADFTLNVVLDTAGRVVRAFAGELEAAHTEACRFVSRCACPPVRGECDVAVTSCGGYPLDATFYQCVKGTVACLPLVRAGGTILAVGGCREGVGSGEYRELMFRYAGRWREFLRDIQTAGQFIKDQWELQMQCRVLEKVGQENLLFAGGRGIAASDLASLSVTPLACDGDPAAAVQRFIDRQAAQGRSIAILPEGPYCTPMA